MKKNEAPIQKLSMFLMKMKDITFRYAFKKAFSFRRESKSRF